MYGLVGAALLLAACSPEAEREPGERGADVGNRPAEASEVELHGKENPNFDVPDLLPPPERSARQ